MRLMIECGLLLLFKKIWQRVYEAFASDKSSRIKCLEFAADMIITETKKPVQEP